MQEGRRLGRMSAAAVTAPSPGASPTDSGSGSGTCPWCIPGLPPLLLLSQEKPAGEMRQDGSHSNGVGSPHFPEAPCQSHGSSQLVLSQGILKS